MNLFSNVSGQQVCNFPFTLWKVLNLFQHWDLAMNYLFTAAVFQESPLLNLRGNGLAFMQQLWDL